MIPLLFSVLLLSSDTTAASPTASQPAEQAAPVKKEKKICKPDHTNTGSRMPKKLCMTAVEWEKHDSGRSAGDLKTLGGR